MMQHDSATLRSEALQSPSRDVPVAHTARREPVPVRVTANAPRRAPRYRVVAVGGRRLRLRADVG